MKGKYYYVYMMTTRYNKVLYIGMTGDLVQRGWQHKERLVDGFTKRYNVTKMVYYEQYRDVHQAIAREKQLKGWNRKKKEALIRSINPEWRDIYEETVQREGRSIR